MSREALFTGRSGQLVVMAEFLVRQMNVAIPEVDVGDDVVVVRDDHDEITRVQVKATATIEERRQSDRFYAQFNLRLSQLKSGPRHLVYALVVRRNDRWEEFLIVRRSVLYELRNTYRVGSEAEDDDKLVLGLTFTSSDVTTSQGAVSFQPFRGAFTPWPPADEVPIGVVGMNPQ